MRRSLLLGAAFVAPAVAAPAKADHYGCMVLLCTAPGSPGWQAIPECVGPAMTALVPAS